MRARWAVSALAIASAVASGCGPKVKPGLGLVGGDRHGDEERRGRDEPHDDDGPAEAPSDGADHRGTGAPSGPTSSHADVKSRPQVTCGW